MSDSVKWRQANFEHLCAARSPEWRAQILAASIREADYLVLSTKAFLAAESAELGSGFAEPSLPDLLLNFAKATGAWAKAGFPLRTAAQTAEVLTICKGSADGLQPACPEWLGDALIPRCRKCGCTALKPWLATEKCPLGKW